MKAQVYDPTTGKRLGKDGLTKNILPMLGREGFRVASHLGDPVIRSGSNSDAWETRSQWQALYQLVGHTGYGVKVSLTVREANALMNGGFLNSNSGTWRLSIREGRVNTLPGHGRAVQS